MTSLRLAPKNEPARVLLSNFHCVANGVDRWALAEVDEVLSRSASNARAHFWPSAVLSAMENHYEAISQVREAVRLEPQAILFHAYEGRVLLYARLAEGAIEKPEQVVEIDPALFVGHLWLALALVEIGQFDRAIEVASSMAAIGDHSVARCCLSYVLARAGYKEDAIKYLEELVAGRATGYVSPVWVAAVCDALHATQKADEQIEAAVTERSYPLIWVRTDPRLRAWA